MHRPRVCFPDRQCAWPTREEFRAVSLKYSFFRGVPPSPITRGGAFSSDTFPLVRISLLTTSSLKRKKPLGGESVVALSRGISKYGRNGAFFLGGGVFI